MTRILVILAALMLAVQFVPVAQENPPLEAPLVVPPRLESILARACYDCHSNDTRWPWYSRVAPVSWMLAHDVREGRERLNFSLWGRLEGKKRIEMIEEIWEEVAEGKMPPRNYRLAHPEAVLSAQDRLALREWLEGQGLGIDGDHGRDRGE